MITGILTVAFLTALALLIIAVGAYDNLAARHLGVVRERDELRLMVHPSTRPLRLVESPRGGRS